ncbi:MAG: hypothetical protein ACRCWR_00960 [Saezia sp.]
MSTLGMKAGRPSTGRNKTLADLADSKEIVRINFTISKDEQIKLKVYAAKHGRSISDILRAYINSIE